MIGKTLAHYRITEQLGKGGMGEVYLADDTTLDRKVALKFLSDAFTSDPERMARFEREAKLLASLNHPNIAGIYGLEQSDGNRFLVLEYVEGETLQARLTKGALPLEDALALCRQIAEGLEAAHEKGVIHRDLKPANVMITAEKKVKILDFGLAKALADETQGIDYSESPTITEAMTRPGVVLGTAAYMSPEQAKGKRVNKRADIWAFGCILFECLTGKRAFEGETVTETLAAILSGEPDWSRLPPNLHSRIRFMLKRCLEKDTKNRYSGISDARVDIQEVQADPDGVLAETVVAAKYGAKPRIFIPWTAVTIILILIAALAAWKFKPSEPRQVMRFDCELPEDQEFSDPRYQAINVSPDGKQFIYSTAKGIYLRPMSESTAKLIAGTEGDSRQPFFSPDGQFIGYFSQSDQKLKKISINGGLPVPLCTVTDFIGASWHESGTIVYGQNPGGIMRISANGGTPEVLVKAAPREILGRPSMLPDGKSVLFTDFGGSGRVMVQSLESGQRKVLFSGANGADYLPTGHIIYSMSNNLFAVPFDPRKIEVGGERAPIIQWCYSRQFAISRTGTLVYILLPASNIAPHERTLVWVDKNGNEVPLEADPNVYRFPTISPDGTRIALSLSITNNGDVWTWDLTRKTLTRLTFGEKDDIRPIWTPDGKRIVFCSNRNGNLEVYWKAADGTGEEEKLASAPDRDLIPHSWSSDGKTLVISEMVGSNLRWDIEMLSIEGERTLKPLLNEEYYEIQPKVSPDGRFIAYTSGESGIEEILVRPFPDVNKGMWQVSTSGGNSPLWSPDGRELFYLNGDSVMAVSVESVSTFTPDTPKLLFRGTYIDADADTSCPWDIHPSGKRFLMMKEQASTASASGGLRKINIVLNWFEELKERAPVD
jgi:Tol biopolymer transport system component/predicted Ser/Thr protein kinase